MGGCGVGCVHGGIGVPCGRRRGQDQGGHHRPPDVRAGRLRQDAALLHGARLSGRAGQGLSVPDAGRAARREDRRDVQVPDDGERLVPRRDAAGARRTPPQLHGQGDRFRDVLPPARHQARAHRHARRVDFRRRGVELPAPPPRHDRDADRLAFHREQGWHEDDLVRRDGVASPPEVDDRTLASP